MAIEIAHMTPKIVFKLCTKRLFDVVYVMILYEFQLCNLVWFFEDLHKWGETIALVCSFW